MSPLPTMSLRCPPEHQALVRDLARALRTRPDLVPAVQALLAEGAPALAAASPVLADVVARLEAVEQWIAKRNKASDAEGAKCNTSVLPSNTAAADKTAGDTTIPNDDALWSGTGKARRLTAFGKMTLVEMRAAGAKANEIAARFGIARQNVPRMMRRALAE